MLQGGSAFKKQGWGRIIDISSGVAVKGNPGMLYYVASKGAIVSITRTLATELGEHGILVNSVAPGFTLSYGVQKNPKLASAASAFSVRNRPLKRDMIPADVVGAVIFFAGPHASFITGQTLVADGGAYYPEGLLPAPETRVCVRTQIDGASNGFKSPKTRS